MATGDDKGKKTEEVPGAASGMGSVTGEEEGLVELMSEQGEANARIIAGVLESEGIEVMLKSHQTFSALPFTVDGMGQVRVMVRKEDLARAREVIGQYSEAGGDIGDLDWMDGGGSEDSPGGGEEKSS